MTTTADKIAALQAEVAALKDRLDAQAKPPEPPVPFKPQPYQRYDPTAGMSMPLSALREMAQHPCNQVMGGVIQDRHAPTSATGMIPSRADVRETAPSSTPGSVDPRPLGPQPGIGLIDRAVNAALPHGPEWGKKKG